MEQFERDGSATLAAMSSQTIAEYLDEERQKAADNQRRTDDEAARIQSLQHGHHRAGKNAKLELLPSVKTTNKKKKKRKTVAIARMKPRATKKIAGKIRKRA